MADEETQGQRDTSPWAPQASGASTSPSSVPSMGFEEPLDWPESPDWDVVAGTSAGEGELPLPEPPIDLEAGFDFLIPDPDLDSLLDLGTEWEPSDAGAPDAPADDQGLAAVIDHTDPTVAHRSDPLGGLGGGGGWSEPAPVDAALTESIWADGASSWPGDDIAPTGAGPTVYAETDGARRRRFGARSGNAAIIAMISLASLVLLGMFLSVRQRDDVPTDVSQQRAPTDQVAVTGSLNTVPFSPTTSPPGSIDIAGLTAAVTDTTEASSAPATTATTRAAPTATTVPATQTTTATTAVTTTTTTTTTRPDDSETTTTLRRTTSSFTVPTISFPTSSTVPASTSTSFPFPNPF